ncbi:Uma2 family endonuclease [Argonema antarcticum]|uniref:Uma2 family endonuclease n=1 Tax=Argonema antarcticum TaxID=2942763 RepID=UPI00201361E8|nr:Uma2 family endonuclease [Argonema antarcticum]MCL1474544.1 Uma2 family endonuclease [Argonema antarcticum A004/B2]
MVVSAVLSTIPAELQATENFPENLQSVEKIQADLQPENVISLEDFLLHPPDRMEWVDGTLLEKTGMTFKHGVAQSKLAYYWRAYKNSGEQGGEVVTEALCRTNKQARRPDVAYITGELLQQLGEFTVCPQSFSLIAEVASPDDGAEELFAKAKEYLESGCQEVWLLFPEEKLVLIKTPERWFLLNPNDVVNTQSVLQGFSVAVKELLS